jgi:hypothetical protein
MWVIEIHKFPIQKRKRIMTSRFCRRDLLKSGLKFYIFNHIYETKADAVYPMLFSESAPHITPGTGLKTKAPRKFFFFWLGCVIYDRLSKHIETNNIFAVEQFGFRTSSSTEKASYKVTDDVLNALNNNDGWRHFLRLTEGFKLR